MPNYYEILQIRPDASAPEVETACEAQYNYWRRLVTHHDPETADKATRALRVLEQIRATLIDPQKRAMYNARVGLSQGMGGLADPAAVIAGSRTMPAPPPALSPASAMPAPSPGNWVCSKCHTPNVIGTQYCAKCGALIAQPCPKCETVMPIIAQFCTHCGVDMGVMRDQVRSQQHHQQINQIQEEINRCQEEIALLESIRNTVLVFNFTEKGRVWTEIVNSYGFRAIIYYIVGTIIGLPVLIISAISIIGIPLLLPIFYLAFNWFALILFIKPGAAQRISEQCARIAELEQKVRQIQAGALGNTP